MSMIQGGVQRESSLGMKYGPVAAEPEQSSEEAPDWEARFEVLEIECAKALEDADRLNDVAVRLLEALRDVLPETCASHAEPQESCPDCSAIALYAEVAPMFAGRVEPCPECRSGKHQNCDGQTMGPDDEIVACPCAEAGHQG